VQSDRGQVAAFSGFVVVCVRAESQFCAGFFEKFLLIAIKGRLQPVFMGASRQRSRNAAVQRELPMRKKNVIDMKAAIKLIAAENLNALRGLLRNIANFRSKPTYLNKKT
jgi:hypothetical protein